MNGRRIAIVATVAVVLVAGVAMALFGGSGKPGATSLGTVGGDGGSLPAVAATDAASSAPIGTGEQLDPAKQEPVLDLFIAKDPFAPLGGVTPTPTPTPLPTPTATPTPTPTPNPINADVSIDGAEYEVAAGDETPIAAPAFYVASLAPSGVTFELVEGQTFDDGSTSVEVAEGQDVVVTNADTGQTYRLSVISLNYGGGGGTEEPVKNGHSIQLMSINTQNGSDTATFKVDGATYADEGVGAELATDWGEIKVLAIDAGAQTATILHGDDTLVVHVGQIIEK